MSFTEIIITELIPVYAIIAVSVFVIGMVYKFARYGLKRLTMKREMSKRTKTPYHVKENSFIKSFWEVNVGSFMRFWARANPITFAGHVLYHTGFFIAVGAYALVMILSLGKITTMPVSETIPLIFDWFKHTEMIFGTTWFLGALGEVMIPVFVFALVCGTIGMSIPFVMSMFKKRGMITPIDDVTRAAGIYTDGTPRSSVLGYQRKIIGLIVLIMGGAMLSTFFTTAPAGYAYIIHVIFGLTILALFPFTFLFHEIYRLRMWSAVLRMRDGRIS